MPGYGPPLHGPVPPYALCHSAAALHPTYSERQALPMLRRNACKFAVVLPHGVRPCGNTNSRKTPVPKRAEDALKQSLHISGIHRRKASAEKANSASRCFSRSSRAADAAVRHTSSGVRRACPVIAFWSQNYTGLGSRYAAQRPRHSRASIAHQLERFPPPAAASFCTGPPFPDHIMV